MSKTSGHSGKQAAGLPSRETFEKLLLATHNIGPGVEPGDAHGEVAVEAAMRTTGAIYEVLDQWFSNASWRDKQAAVDGAVTALALLVETACASSPETYAKRETKRGLSGERHEFEGAEIKLPIEFSVAKT